MRGYRNMKKSGTLGSVSALKRELTIQQLTIEKKSFPLFFYGAGLESAELVVKFEPSSSVRRR